MKNDATNANYHFKYGAALGMKAMEINRLRALLYIGDFKEAIKERELINAIRIGSLVLGFICT